MRPRLRFSDIVSLLALFVALGGTSYAALRISGKEVRDGSLTGKDIKKGSVPLDRLSTRPKDGANGAAGVPGASGEKGAPGEKGDTGAAGPGAPNALTPGQIAVTAAADRWKSNGGLTHVDSPAYTTFTQAPGGPGYAYLSADLPATVNGRPLTVTGIRLCYDADGGASHISSIELSHRRPAGASGGSATSPVFDTTARSDAGCPVLQANPPKAMEPGDQLILFVGLTNPTAASGTVDLGTVVLYFSQG
jgi:hypothetical protein